MSNNILQLASYVIIAQHIAFKLCNTQQQEI